MKSISKASPEVANKIAADLLSKETAGGDPIFFRRSEKYGFEIFQFVVDERSSLKSEKMVFRYNDFNGVRRIEYDEELIKID